MRRVTGICAGIVVLAFAGVAVAGTDAGIYTDPIGTGCTLEDNVPGLHEVHVVYTGTEAITLIEFQVVQTDGAQLTYLAEQGPNPNWSRAGRAPDGISVAMADCYEAPVLVLTIFYAGSGVSSACGRLELRNNPLSLHSNPGFIATITCANSGEITWVPAGDAVINPDGGCTCASGSPTPTAESTWGGIKALYD